MNDDEIRLSLASYELIAFAGGLGLATRLREGVDARRRETGSTERTYPRLEGTTFVVPRDCLEVAARCLADDEDRADYVGLVGRLRVLGGSGGDR